ncbi:hypothetical protein HYE26_00885 [Mycoplasmopsis bovis]|nr:hypothetical protein [Mycoplasmopsis bovis]QQH23186.1 hypothetical protein HYE26_00885 [Mycoplasmopsis bovis]
MANYTVITFNVPYFSQIINNFFTKLWKIFAFITFNRVLNRLIIVFYVLKIRHYLVLLKKEELKKSNPIQLLNVANVAKKYQVNSS